MMSEPHNELTQRTMQVETLRTQLAEMTQRAEELDKLTTMQDGGIRGLHAQIRALTERAEKAERALARNGYRQSCDIAACNCGDQWNHGGRADERLREIDDALPWENGKTILQRVSDLTAQLATVTAVSQHYVDELAEAREQLAALTEKQRSCEAAFNGYIHETAHALSPDDPCVATTTEQIMDLLQRLAAQQQEIGRLREALASAVTLAAGDQDGLPMASSDMDCGFAVAHILATDTHEEPGVVVAEIDVEKHQRNVMILAEFRAVTRMEERKAIAQILAQALASGKESIT